MNMLFNWVPLSRERRITYSEPVELNEHNGGVYVQDVRANNRSCIICTSTIHDGRMLILHRYMDATYLETAQKTNIPHSRKRGTP